jgi:hypothetical protein
LAGIDKTAEHRIMTTVIAVGQLKGGKQLTKEYDQALPNLN